MRYVIENALIVNEGEVYEADVLVSGGIIAGISRRDCNRAEVEFDRNDAVVIDAGGKYLIPGIIDEHVHFREPGLTRKADIYSESRAAVSAGVTSFMDMPNTVPQTITNQLLEEKFTLASEKSLANFSFYLGAAGDNLREIRRIDPGRVCGIKLFMGSSTGNMLIDDEKTLEAVFRESPCLIAAHCEDEETIRRNTERLRAVFEAGGGLPDASIHPEVRSAQACRISSSRAVSLALKTGARLHILHVSTAAELDLLRNDIPLREKKITAETCPHYLKLDQSCYPEMGYSIKCNPAIKSEGDRSALIAAVHSGLVDTIGTDHAPHLRQEKFASDYFNSKSGFPSIQHSFDLMYSIPGMKITEIVSLMCHNPAILYRICRRGFIREGYFADLAIVDPNYRGVIRNADVVYKCGWSPYDGFKIRSKVTHTFVNGNLVFENGEFHEESRGERLSFSCGA